MYIYGQFGLKQMRRFGYNAGSYPYATSDEVYWVPPGWTHESGENVQDIGVMMAVAQHPWEDYAHNVRIDKCWWVFKNDKFVVFLAVAYCKYYDHNDRKPVVPISISQLIGKHMGVEADMDDDTGYNKDPNAMYRH